MPEEYSRETPDRHERVYVTRKGPGEHRERVVTDISAERRNTVYTSIQLVWLFFGILMGLIGLRILLLLIGANPASPFASLVYGFTDLFLWPFFGVVSNPSINGLVLEISSIIALFVYALMAWAIVRVIRVIFFRPSSSHIVETYDRDPR